MTTLVSCAPLETDAGPLKCVVQRLRAGGTRIAACAHVDVGNSQIYRWIEGCTAGWSIRREVRSQALVVLTLLVGDCVLVAALLKLVFVTRFVFSAVMTGLEHLRVRI
jgi:hypothetical protein